jgi:hypothetical protein
MDTSKEYILMCEKAVEIQEVKDFFNEGDFVVNPLSFKKTSSVISYSRAKIDINQNMIWLPRQDQLQGMVEYCPLDLIQKFKNFCWRSHEGIKLDYEAVSKMSMEQLWLAFVMKEKYNKTWNGKEWIQ